MPDYSTVGCLQVVGTELAVSIRATESPIDERVKSEMSEIVDGVLETIARCEARGRNGILGLQKHVREK